MPQEEIDDRNKPSPDWTRPPEPPIHRAARTGDVEALRTLVTDGVNIDERSDLEHNNAPCRNDLTPLMIAARSIDGATVETLRWLVENGSDIHATSDGGNTAAWYAAGHGGRWDIHQKAITPDHSLRLEYLLNLGLDIHECSCNGTSLLTEACDAGDPARVALLLRRGVSADVIAGPSENPRPFDNVLDAMFDREAPGPGADVPTSDKYDFQIPLFCAARSGSAECVRLILDAGVDVDKRDLSGKTPLMVAGSREVVQLLLSAGSDRDAVNEFGKDALATFLEDSCDSDTVNSNFFEVAQALCDAGFDIEKRERYGKSRLASAAFGHEVDAVDVLLRLGARPDACNKDGSTALHSICWQGEYDDDETNDACEKIIRTLIAAGVDVNAQNDGGQTAMHEATSGDWGNQTAIRTLLELGALPDPRDINGITPLMLASCNGELDCIKLLCNAEANPTLVNNEGKSALDFATEHLNTWQSIVKSGPDKGIAEFQVKLSKQLADEYGAAPERVPSNLNEAFDQMSQSNSAKLQAVQAVVNYLRSESEKRLRDGDSPKDGETK